MFTFIFIFILHLSPFQKDHDDDDHDDVNDDDDDEGDDGDDVSV